MMYDTCKICWLEKKVKTSKKEKRWFKKGTDVL
jgi:hypothetical protein